MGPPNRNGLMGPRPMRGGRGGMGRGGLLPSPPPMMMMGNPRFMGRGAPGGRGGGRGGPNGGRGARRGKPMMAGNKPQTRGKKKIAENVIMNY